MLTVKYDFNINTITMEKVKSLIASGDNQHDYQIRINKSEIVYLSRDVGADNLMNVLLRLETCDAGNNYVGPLAAANDVYVKVIYTELVTRWKEKIICEL